MQTLLHMVFWKDARLELLLVDSKVNNHVFDNSKEEDT